MSDHITDIDGNIILHANFVEQFAGYLCEKVFSQKENKLFSALREDMDTTALIKIVMGDGYDQLIKHFVSNFQISKYQANIKIFDPEKSKDANEYWNEYWHNYWRLHFEKEQRWMDDKKYMAQYPAKTNELKKMRELGIYHHEFSVKALMLAYGGWGNEPYDVRVTLYKKAFHAIDVIMEFRGTPEFTREYKINLLKRTKASPEEKALFTDEISIGNGEVSIETIRKEGYQQELSKAKEWRKSESEAALIERYRLYEERYK